MLCGHCHAQLPMIPNLRFCPVCGTSCSNEALFKPDKLENEIVAILQSGKTIEAIKRYRKATNFGLKEAKTAVEAIALKRHVVVERSASSSFKWGWIGRLIAALFMGFMMATAGLALFPAVGKMASPFLCEGTIQVESHTYRRPGETTVTRNFFCPDGREVTFRTAGISCLIYSAAGLILIGCFDGVRFAWKKLKTAR